MGLDRNGTRFLCHAAASGVDFRQTLCIGRQWLLANPKELSLNLNEFGFESPPPVVDRLYVDSDGYAEPFLKLLGAHNPRSLDYSDYEGASDLHNLNQPAPDKLKKRFSVVIDGGSLEHVFNLPVALQNCMEMVAVGGHLLLITPANNHMGHGFYQFSPELFYTALSKENGFHVEDMFAFEDGPNDQWFRVCAPREVNTRVWSINRRPVYLLVKAQRISEKPIFAETPQQSDYETSWNHGNLAEINAPTSRVGLLRSTLTKLIPRSVKKRLRTRLYAPTFDPRFFSPVHSQRKSA